MEDIRTLFQQASKKADIKKQISKKRTRKIIDSDSEDEFVIYPTKPKINTNKLSVNKESTSIKTCPLEYFKKYSDIQDASSKFKESAPPVKKLRTDTDSQEGSQGTNTLIQNIGDLDIQLSPTLTIPVMTSSTDKTNSVILPQSTIHSPTHNTFDSSIVPKSTISSPTANTSFSSTGKCDTPIPSLSKHNSSNAGNYFAYMNRAGPANLGGKDIPIGQDNCLGNLAFVITGVLDSLERDEAKELIQKYGGRVVGSLSKKVTHLVVGLEAGESKMEKARHLKVKEISEDDLLEMIRTRSSVGSKPVVSSSVKKKAKTVDHKAIANKPISISDSIDLCHPGPTPPDEDVNMDVTYDNPILLVDKYRPTCVREIIGSAREASVANKLIKWLKNWFIVNRRGCDNASKPVSRGYFNKDPSIFKSVLLSGPPGIGKTTTATLVCKELGMSYVEMNASSTRSKNNLQDKVSQLLSNYSLLGCTQSSSSTTNDKHVLIMDEVDGMAGNEDRGGVQELISLIKSTKIPIICICNDKQNQKMRSLVHYCYDITVPRPTTDQIKGAMLRITCREGLSIPPNALEEMIVASGHDVRQVIHNISMWTANKKTLSFEEVKENAQNAKKVTAMGPFDVIRNVFSRQNTKSNPVDEKLDLFFQDYSFGPLFVQENYPLIRPVGARGDPLRHLELLALTADSLSTSDIINKRIRGAQNWKLLPMQGFFSTVYPGELLQGNFAGKIEFPKWFGNNSKSNKYQRIVGELCTHTRLHTSGSVADVTMDYIPSWYQKVTRAIATEQIQEAAGFLCEYELLKEDWDSISELGLYSGHRDVMSQIAPKVKAQLTRATNKERGTLHYKVDQSFRKLKIKQDDEFGEMDIEDEIIGTQENDDISQNQMIQQKTVAPPAKKKPAKTKSVKTTQKPKKTKK